MLSYIAVDQSGNPTIESPSDFPRLGITNALYPASSISLRKVEPEDRRVSNKIRLDRIMQPNNPVSIRRIYTSEMPSCHVTRYAQKYLAICRQLAV